MKPWESLIDQTIRQAIEQGEFDDLAGKNEPLDLSENPFEDPDLRTAHRLLRNAGFAPAWIEDRKDIEAEFGAARTALARVWRVLQNARGTAHEPGATVRWETALAVFREKIRELNRRITAWNLKAPAAGFHTRRIDAEHEISKIRS